MKRDSALEMALRSPDYLVVYGSGLYGTNTPESDNDERGFVIPPFEYLFGLCRFDQKVETNPDDRVVWSLAKFVSMLIKGDPQAYEMLFAPEDLILACSEAGRKVRDARSLFACQRFHRRVTGYAQSEWRKVRGVTLEPVRRSRTEDEVINDIRAVFAPDKPGMDEVIWLLFLDHDRKEISATRKLGAKRKAQVEEHGFCTSSASHSVRLIGELEELLKSGKITFPRPNADWLRDVKQGRVPFAEVEQAFEDAKLRVEAAYETTQLPEKPSVAAIERLYHSIVATKILADERVREYAEDKAGYQLHAVGRLHPSIGLDGSTTIVSKRVFTSPEAADGYISAFKESCTAPKNDRDMSYMDPAAIRISVVPLELIG